LRWRTGDFVNGLTWSADGRWIASAENGGVARLWDATTGRPVCVLAGHREAVTSVAFSPDGKRLVTASKDSVPAWDRQTGQRLYTIQFRARREPGQEVASAVFASDGKTVVVFSRGEVIRLGSSNGKELSRVSLAAPAGHALSPQGDRVAICREGGTIQLHD